MKKNLAVIALCLTVGAGSLTACGGGTQETTKAQTTAAAAVTEAPAATEAATEAAKTSAETSAENQAASAGAESEIPAGIAEGPVLLTSVGQSADVNVVQTLLKKCEIECDMDATVTADGIADYKTLVLAIGGSSKGLGAAGVNENEEIDRVKAVIAKAQEQGITIVALHIGGSARRGTLSDKFVPDALKAATAAIIVSEGDADGMMKAIVTEGNIPTAYVDNQVGAIEPLKTIFGK